jgi:hypothetical protein
MFKKYVGLDFLDLLIHIGVSVAVTVVLASVAGSGPGEEAAIAVGFGLSLVTLAWRRTRALAAARTEWSTGEVQAERITELEHRVAELEAGHGRLLELEERLDFTERLLTRQRDADRLAAGPGE